MIIKKNPHLDNKTLSIPPTVLYFVASATLPAKNSDENDFPGTVNVVSSSLITSRLITFPRFNVFLENSVS